MDPNTAQCPICHEVIRDMRILPCIHSFCFECLEQYCRSKLPGDDVPCPECRTDFAIPKNGVAGLPVRSHARYPRNVLEQNRGHYCEQHEDERIKMYCFDCSVNVCAMCCLEEHKTHNFERIEQVVDQFFRSIDDEVEQTTSYFERFCNTTAQIEAEYQKTLNNVEKMELEVKKKSEHVVEKFTHLVERQTNDVLQQLQSLKRAAEDGMKSHTDTMQLALTEMDSFRTSSSELKSKGSPSDITQAASDIHDRAKELLETFVIPREYNVPRYNFTPVNVDELIKDDQNFIGHVVEVDDSATKKVSDGSTSRDTATAQETASSREQQQPLQGNSVETCRQSYLSTVKKKVSGGVSSRVGATAQHTSSSKQQQQSNTVETFRQSYLNSDARVIKKISTKHYVCGVTSVDDELFALLKREDNQDQVAVYSINSYKLLRHLNLPVYMPSNITSCVRYKCLYMSEYDNKCIHRYDLRRDIGAKMKRIGGSRISKWPVFGNPCGLSVTTSCNLLVTCRCQDEPDKLVELRPDDGLWVRQIALQSAIEDPWHGVQLTNGQFVVCHGSGRRDLNQVCVVGADGEVECSYGSQLGSDIGLLAQPCHLAVDTNSQFVFVADTFHNRVALLSPTLQFVRYVIEDLSWPCRLYFHQSTRRLFVGQWLSADVTVIQL